jgi:hypothetical protein
MFMAGTPQAESTALARRAQALGQFMIKNLGKQEI